jgi:hypothetical protein
LFRNGKIKGETLVWREGMKEWQPFATASPEIPPLLSARSATANCAECGKAFPAEELITLNKATVCAGCKPIFLQRMVEGAPTPGGAGIWREGKKLVTRTETPFPDRCVKCNQPANGFRLKRVLYWQHPAYYLLLLLNILILLIVVLIERKKAVLHIGLCDTHRSQRRTAIAACVAGVFAGPALMVGPKRLPKFPTANRHMKNVQPHSQFRDKSLNKPKTKRASHYQVQWVSIISSNSFLPAQHRLYHKSSLPQSGQPPSGRKN